ncbi:MAG TPA: hypothetical protein VF169_27780 [Albitalea sp.]|uniref:DUF6882 domain-containing protein n=1 Tax=Piscinibacter sp. TaxID=1903157 RepID=UPI002ED54C98
MSPFDAHLTRHIGSSFARQLAFADFLGDGHWGADLDEGVFTYTPDKRLPLQVLGSESEVSGTWLWAWGNEQAGLSPSVLQAAHAVREFGEANDIAPLTTRSFALDDISGHAIAMLCAGLAGGKCYYRGPYDGGAAFFLVDGVPAQVLASVAPARAVTVIQQVISQFDVDHRAMVRSFMQQQGYAIEEDGSTLRAAAASGGALRLSFDTLGRLASIEGTLTPAPKKRGWQFWK